MVAVQRYSPITPVSLAVTAVLATTAQLPYGAQSGGTIHIPTGSGITSLTVYSVVDGADHALYDTAGAAVALTVAANRAYPIPAAAFGCSILKFVGNTSGTINVTLKG